MSTTPNMPKLVYFQNKYADDLPEFLLTHKQEHVDCLSLFFDVTVIQHDCDYQQICDLYQPDLTLFESGVNLSTCRKPKITNVRACRTVPKLGLFNADAWCETRSGSLSEMDQWGIETFFSISATAAEHMPAIANQLFVWPNFINPTVYRDYNEAKLIPVLLSGATAAQYPWRRRIYKLIAEHYPSLWCPHRGYLSRSSAGQVLSGISYARTISASQLAPVCGTVAKEIVRKHFEIPACNTCLITERARNLEEAGFIDMVNCVFADEHDILDKLESLFKQPELLHKITAAGHQLVHSQHTHKHRDQILQWFNLNKNLDTHEKIVQTNPFAPLTAVNKVSQKAPAYSPEIGAHLQLLREGDEMLWAGLVGAADSKYRRCLSYMHRLPEARFKIALCKLYKGEAEEASSRIFELIQYCISQYRSVDPDPVEWAYYIVSLLCLGKLNDATSCASEFPWLQHPELDRVRRVVYLLNRTAISNPSTFKISGDMRHSVHELPERSETVWREELYKMLLVCGQLSIAEVIANTSFKTKLESAQKKRFASVALMPSHRDHMNEPRERKAHSLLEIIINTVRLNTIDRKLARYKVRQKLRNINTRLTPLFRKISRHIYTMPETHTSDKHLFRLIRELARDLNVRTVLIIGGSIAEDTANAVLEGTLGSNSKPLICCIDEGIYSVGTNNVGSPAKDYLKLYPLLLAAKPEVVATDFENIIRRAKCDNLIDCFDVVVVACPEIEHQLGADSILRDEMRSARLIILRDLESEYHREIYAQLSAQPNHVFLDHSTSGGSYVMFGKASLSREQSEVISTCSSSPIYAE
jgi:Glycosyl transferases group 1